jgi:hypothetical protein
MKTGGKEIPPAIFFGHENSWEFRFLSRAQDLRPPWHISFFQRVEAPLKIRAAPRKLAEAEIDVLAVIIR